MNITAETFDSLTWEPVTTEQLQQAIKGGVVLQIEPVYWDYARAIIDDMQMIIKNAAGDLFAVSIQANTDDFISMREAINSHKSPTQHRQFLKMDARKEKEYSLILSLYIAKIPGQDNARAAQIDQSGSRP